MGLTLHLLRHAKSSWKDPGQSDHDRPLNKRGRGAADAMGAFLAREGPVPGRVLCSSARRTRETFERVAQQLAAPPAVSVEADLYLSSPAKMLEHIRTCGPEVACLMLIAHSPGTEDLARSLAGGGDEDAWHRLRAKYPTGALTTLRFDVASWADVAPSGGELVRFVVPRELD